MKKLSLDPAQWATLNRQFRLVSAEDRDQINSIRTIDLLDPQLCTELLDYLTPVIHSPSRRVTASLLSKRIAFLSTASSLYAMSTYNHGLNMSLQNCYLEFGYENRLWQSHMPLADLSLSAPENGQRDSWRRMLIRQLFADNLSHIWQVMVEVAKVPLSILWENTAVRVYSLYERRMTDLSCACQQSRAYKDFRYLINEAPAELFGTSENPLHKYFWPRQQAVHSNKSVRFRKTCCYYYQASEPKEYCSTCPLIRPKRPRKSKHKEIITV